MKKAMIAVAAMAASGTAFAGAHASGGNGPSWTYAEANYLKASTYEALASDEIDGYNIAGSKEFATKWHFMGSYGTTTIGDFSFPDIDVDIIEVRIGGHPALTANTDFVADIGYKEWDIDTNSPVEVKPSAIDVRLGVRTQVTDSFELSGYLSYATGDFDLGSDDDFDTIVPSVGGQYNINENVSVNMTYEWNSPFVAVAEGEDLTSFGIRYSW